MRRRNWLVKESELWRGGTLELKNVIEIESYENIPEYVGIKNTGSITVKDGYEWYGHSYGICVGIIYDDGTVDSYIKKESTS